MMKFRLALLFVGVAISCAAAAGDETSEALAIKKIELLGGSVTTDEAQPQAHVIEVDLRLRSTLDRERFREKYFHVKSFEVLESFPHLKRLILTNTTTTDQGLESIKKLTRLQELFLGGTQVTDAGLLELKDLKQLKLLDLWDKPASFPRDTPMDLLDFRGAKARESHLTQTGIRKLKEHLPDLIVQQPPMGLAQPNRIDFGVVYAGATAQAGAQVFFPKIEDDKTAAAFVPPAFMKVLRHEIVHKPDLTSVILAVALDTSTPGDWKGNFRVALGDREVEFPVSGQVLAAPPEESTRVLIASTPYTHSSTSDAALFDPWRQIVASGRLNPDYLLAPNGQSPLRDLDLDQYQVVLLACEGLLNIGGDDVAKLDRFVQGGGHLLIFANHFFRGTVDKANLALKRYGITIEDTEPRNIQDPAIIEKHQIVLLKFTQGIDRLRFDRPSPITSDPARAAATIAKTDKYFDRGVVAMGYGGSGDVVVIGVSLWWNWIALEKEKESDNARLLENLLTRPRQSK